LISGLSFSQTTVKKVTSEVAIDGQLEESYWDITNQLSINLNGCNNSAAFGVLWDENYLYIGIVVTDETLCTNGRQGWFDDGVEIYIDGNYSQGTTFDQYDRLIIKPVKSYWIQEVEQRIDGIIHRWIETNNGYSMEFAIPWDNFNINPSVGMDMGFNVAVNDDDYCNSNNSMSQLLWSGVATYYEDPSCWGTLTLSGQTVTYSGDYIALINPNGGDFCIDEKTTSIEWVAYGIANVNLEYSTNNGNSWNSIATNVTAGSGSYDWDVSSTPSDVCLVKISDANNSALYDISYALFTISEVLGNVEPLIHNSWDNYQWPYNAYYPEDENGINGHVGNACGHSSLARILHAWEFPIVGNDELTFTDNGGHTWSANFGETTYNYDNMPNYLPPNSTEEEYTDVATLFYHAATSMHDISGNGGNLEKMSYAMSHYFRYKESVPTERKNYTKAEWIQIVKAELDSGRVLLVNGMTLEVPGGWHESNWIAGHWYHVDGYNDDGDLHVVVGYGNEDDFYDADSLVGFAYNLGILTGLEPELNGKTLSLVSHNGGEVLTTGEETEITWSSTNVPDIIIEYTINNGQDWEVINDDVPASDGSFFWTTPDVSSDECKIKLTDVTDVNVYDKSNDVFSIGSEPAPALFFDGDNDLALIYGFTFPANDLTIEAWIKPEEFGERREIFFGKNPDNSSGVQFRIEEDGKLLYGETPTWDYIMSPEPCITLNEWNHVAVVKHDGLCKLFVNGSPVVDGMLHKGIDPTVISVGGRHNNMDRFFSGLIVEMRIWNIARTQGDLETNMNCFLTGTENGLNYYWHMNEGQGQTVFDQSGNNNNLTLGFTEETEDNDPQWILTTWPFPVIPVGVSEFASKPGLLAWPNPTTGNFTIDLGEHHQQAKISIRNVTGQIIHIKTYRSIRFVNLELQFKPGIYFVEVSNAHNKPRTAKIIIK